MKIDFAQNARRNLTAEAVNSFLRLLFPFLNRSLFLWLLGPEYLGLNGLFGSILGMLSLAELGFGTAVTCSLYKPIADDDQEQVRAYLHFYRAVYRGVGTFILAAGLCLLPFLRILVHGNIPTDVNLYLLYLIHLSNTAASYFFFAYRGSILSAHNRNDILSHIRTIVAIVQYIAVFLILLLTRNYYFYVLATVAFTIFSNILIFRESRRLFPDLEPRGQLPEEKRRAVLSEVKSIFLHKVGAVISYQADNLIISAFLGLVAVAAYGNYYYVVTSVSGLVGVLYAGMHSGFGNKIHTETKAKNFALLMRMCHLTQIAILWCAAMMMALYQPFVNMWVRYNPSLTRHALTPILMVLYFYVNQSRHTLMTFKGAAGLWRQDRWKPIVASIVNLTLNISFVLFFPEEYKLDGVILSTIISYIVIQIPWETHVLFTHFFGSLQQRHYWRFHAKFAALAILLCAISWGTVHAITMEKFPGLVVKGLAAAAVTTAFLFLFFRQEFCMVLQPKRFFSADKDLAG